MDHSGNVTILAGRTRRLWQPLLQQLRIAHELGGRCLLIVPEHYTLQAERALISDLGANGLLTIEVLSPSRLVQRVRDRAGTGPRVPIDDLGRSMTVMRALEKSRADLWFYYSSTAYPGFAPRMARVIAAIKEGGIAPETIQSAIDSWPEGALQSKMHDTALVYSFYQELLAGQFADQEDQARDVHTRLQESRLFHGHHVFVYGFDMFTTKLCDLITSLAPQAAHMLVTIVSDKAQAPDGNAFSPVRESTLRLTRALNLGGMEPHFVWTDDPLNAPPDILHLERNLLSVSRPVYAQGVHAVRLYAAPDPYGEVRNAAENIVNALRKGIPPSRIMVLCGNFARYAGLISSLFSDYGIPYYNAEKHPLTGHGLIRATLSALRCIADGWRREDVLDYLKSGFSALSEQDIWTLENYANSYGIGGNRWRVPFDRGPEETRLAAERLRLALTAPLNLLHQALLKAATSTESIQAVLDFLHRTQADTRAVQLEQTLLKKGLPEQAIRTRQVWGRLCAMFEQMYALLNDARIPIGRFADWLEAGLGAEDISALPAAAECVQCGEIGRLIPDEPQVLVLLGLNDGILSGSQEELLNDVEVKQAEQLMNVTLGLRGKLKTEMSLLDLWKAVSAPTQTLFLSFALRDEEGNVLRPLGNVAAIKAMLPQLVEEGGALAPEESTVAPIAAAPALDALALFLSRGQVPPHWQEAWAHLCHDPYWTQTAAQVFLAAGGEPPPSQIPAALADRLYDRGTTSVSRLETFAWCPFRHFVTYGLRPLPVQEWQVMPSDRGLFYHEVLERFVLASRQLCGWPDVTREVTDALVDELSAPALSERIGTPFQDNARTGYMVHSMKEVVRRIAWMITKGAQGSAFRPELTEVRFGYPVPNGLPPVQLKLKDGSALNLHGLIDRIDLYAGPEGRYLRVVDYKSGDLQLRGERILGGQQLQLLVYLQAALQMDARYQAAGAFYQHLEDPVVREEDPAKAEQAAEKKLRLSGIALNDRQVHNLMENPEKPLTLRTRFRADGEPYAGDPLFSGEEISALTGFAKRKAAQLADDLMAGAVHRQPAMDRNGRGPCDYCEYAGICRRDALDGMRDARLLEPRSLRALASDVTGIIN